ncbi:magnesium-translocating P-type ATPase [Thorsellia anophelis]|uniref:Magnesium-transporting ATPase, P-type 1 n=1 Tax=Thorsellia anophelis DSM 18579 TaxID=1123402 RepID=A0A1I0E7S8_9GAMM|nr:magnesium-translocating P-type ATPase [Thorsellia anophelis]SET40749.1 Mg2+-importing ATPase [Thorsellia anophelis DSM 18579]
MTYQIDKNSNISHDKGADSKNRTSKRTDRKKLRQNETIEAKVVKWANPSIDATVKFFNSDYQGLTQSDADARLHRNGLNEIRHDAPPHFIVQLLRSFNSPFIYVLLGLAVISYFTDIKFAEPEDQSWVSIMIIIIMVSLSGLLRFIQEYRSSKASENLKSLVSNRATVLRRENKNEVGVLREIEMKKLVVGDIVQLEAGDMIPADIRLLESRDLFVSQAVLTGEALPVEKYDTLGAIAAKTANRQESNVELGALDAPSLCFMGTNVVSGSARGLVIATGGETYFGSLAKNVTTQKRVETHFDRGVNSVSWVLIKFMLVMVPIVFAINWYTKGDMLSALTFALAVAVGLTPEMLPMIVSTNLAKGAITMARRKVVVKRLNSVQNLGAMDVLCTDKTGTLTRDHIILEHHLNVKGQTDSNVLSFAWLNSFHQSGQKNLMDRAILKGAVDADIPNRTQVYQKIDELPFDFIRRRLSVVLSEPNGKHIMITKGAVEEMLEVSTHFVDDNQVKPLDAASKHAILSQAEFFNEDGFRVLLIASKMIMDEETKSQYTTADETQLVIRGFLTFLDPPKETAEAAILALKNYGVAVKVLTGDSVSVAAKVCDLVGLEVNKPLTGSDIDKMDDVELCQLVENTVLFAKLTPLQKSRVIKALQANGHTVGFLGDGINDAPALRDADVGISVDTAADIAKETADIILLEKSLMVLEEGVVKGRETFGNILKYLNMTASSNFGNVFSVLVASAWLPWEPMLAIHLLIQNLIYDISQMVLPWDKMDKEFLKTPRKWNAPNIRRFMLWLGPTSSVFDISTYILMWTVFGAGAAYALHGGTAGQDIMNSGWFVVGLVSQTLVVHMLRTRKIPFIQSCASWPIVVSTTIAIAIACYLPFSPLASSIGFIPLDGSYFYWLVATMVAYMTLTQIVKTIYIKRYGEWY